MRVLGTLLALLGIAAVSACTGPRSQFPVLPAQTERDAALDCGGLEDELLRANALRDAILDEHGDVLVANNLGNAANMTDPLIGGIITAATLPGQLREYERYREAAEAAEARMIRVLDLRRRAACAEAVSRDPPQTERQILADLEDLERRFGEGSLTEAAYRAERRDLLDRVR